MTCTAKLCGFNQLEGSYTITFSTEDATHTFANGVTSYRSQYWKPTGYFEITDANNKLYINDGADKTITLTNDGYDTPVLLATHIETQLNASSSNWTVSYSSTTFKFTIANTGSVTLRLSEVTDSVADTIGFVTIIDLTDTSFIANEQRNHTSEFFTIDLGTPLEVNLLAILPVTGLAFTLSDDANIRIRGSNVSDLSVLGFDETVNPESKGVFASINESFRYWRVDIEDKLNPLGSEGLNIGQLFFGQGIEFTNRTISKGFNKVINDPSQISQSINGILYFDDYPKFVTLNNLSFNLLSRADKDAFENFYITQGISLPFYLITDPDKNISDEIGQYGLYCVFDSEPSFTHVYADIFRVDFNVREFL